MIYKSIGKCNVGCSQVPERILGKVFVEWSYISVKALISQQLSLPGLAQS